MATTIYTVKRSVIASATPEERRQGLLDMSLFLSHLDSFGLALVNVQVRQGKVEIAISGPLPPEQEEHLGVILS